MITRIVTTTIRRGTETLISSLPLGPNFTVTARGIVLCYKGNETSTKKIGEALKVRDDSRYKELIRKFGIPESV